jgi:hypothetical protein
MGCLGTRRAGVLGSPFLRAGELGRPLTRFERLVKGLEGGCKGPLLPHLVGERVNIISLHIWEGHLLFVALIRLRIGFGLKRRMVRPRKRTFI